MTEFGPDQIEEKFHKLLAEDSRSVPDSYRRNGRLRQGSTRVPVEQFTSRAFHELGVEKVWKRAWQADRKYKRGFGVMSE